MLDSGHIRFRGPDGNVVYSPETVREFGIGQGKIYKAIKGAGTDTPIRFRRLLVSGKATLYQDSTRFLLFKSGGDSVLVLEEIKTLTKEYQKVKKQYIGAFTYAMMDCPQLQDQIQATRFELKAMSRLVHAYNLCTATGRESTMHIGHESVSWEWGVQLQGALTHAAFVGDRLSESFASLKFKPGLGSAAGVHFQANIKSGWSVRLGLQYVYRPHEATGKTEFYSTKATLNNQWVEMPIAAVRYFSLNQRSWKPFVSAGILTAYGNRGQSFRTTTPINGGSYTEDLSFGKFAFGVNIGTGIRFQLPGNSALDLEYQYQQATAKSTTAARFYAHLLLLRWVSPLTKVSDQ
jgi:opacity protein-like surface antigen